MTVSVRDWSAAEQPRIVNQRTGKKPANTSRSGLPATLWVAALVLVNIVGASYYAAPVAVRVRHALHPTLKPSGTVGQSAGILAFLIFVFLWLYPLRKRWRALAFTGPVGKWLNAHVTLAVGLPLLLTIHAAWRADGLIGLGFGAMLVVCASGFVGKYLYARIPRTRSGVELSREEAATERERLLEEIAQAVGLPVADIERAVAPDVRSSGASVVRVMERLVLNDWRRLQRVRELSRAWSGSHGADRKDIARAVKLASAEIALADQLQMLDATQRVFRYWHIAHMPFALTALIAVTVHVVVVVALGATWFW